jgi:hypothetical protein
MEWSQGRLSTVGNVIATTSEHLMKFFEQKSCSGCGESFTCGPAMDQDRCWCDRLPHVTLVTDSGQDCLCYKCLREAIDEVSGTSNSEERR